MTRPSFDQAVDEVSIAPSWWMVMFRALTSHGVQKKHVENPLFVDRFLGKPWVFHILVLPRSIFRNMMKHWMVLGMALGFLKNCTQDDHWSNFTARLVKFSGTSGLSSITITDKSLIAL